MLVCAGVCNVLEGVLVCFVRCLGRVEAIVNLYVGQARQKVVVIRPLALLHFYERCWWLAGLLGFWLFSLPFLPLGVSLLFRLSFFSFVWLFLFIRPAVGCTVLCPTLTRGVSLSEKPGQVQEAGRGCVGGQPPETILVNVTREGFQKGGSWGREVGGGGR